MRFRRKARRSGGFRGFARRASRHAGVGKSANLIQMDAMIYGGLRAPASNWIQSVLPIPVMGSVGDELAMGLLDYLVAKNTSGMIRDVALKGLVIENARLGEAVVSGGLGMVTGTASGGYVYG